MNTASGIGITTNVFGTQIGSGNPYPVDKAWLFDGVDEYIPFQNGTTQIIQPDQASLNATGFSFSIWVKPTRENYDLPIWGNNNLGPDSNLNAGLVIGIHNSNRIVVQMGGAFNTGSQGRRSGLSDQTIPVNQWTHLCCTWNSVASNNPSWLLWINGQPSALSFSSNPYGATFNPGSYVGDVQYSQLQNVTLVARSGSFGCNRSGTRFFEGQMTEGVAYSTAITDSIAEAIYNDGTPINPTIDNGNYTISSDIEAFWSAKDSPVWQENFYTWKEHSQLTKQSAYSLHLDEASSQYYTLGNGTGTTATLGVFDNDFSYTGWIAPSLNTGSMAVIQSGDGLSAGGFLLYRNGSALNFRVSYNGGYDQINSIVVLQQWNFFCVTYTASTKELTIDTGSVGSPIQTRVSAIGTDPIDNVGGPWTICFGNRIPTGSIPFDGWMDDFASYNQVLTAAEANELFTAAQTPQSLNAGCTGWFKFGDNLSYPDPAYSNNWHLVNAVVDADISSIITEAGVQVTAEDGTPLEVETAGSGVADMIGINTIFYDEINGDMSTLPYLPSPAGPTTPNVPSAAPYSQCNAWTVNMEEGDLITVAIP